MSFSYVQNFGTRAVHAGSSPGLSSAWGIPTEPAPWTSPARQPEMSRGAGQRSDPRTEDCRTAQDAPTFSLLEERMTALEGGTAAVALPSGSAAYFLISQVLAGYNGEVIVARRLFDRINQTGYRGGWKVKRAGSDDISSFEEAVSPRTKAILVESISHSGDQITDLAPLSRLARCARVPLIVDNSMASPYLCKPVEYGADIVLHADSAFLSGHAETTGSVVVDAGSFDWSQENQYPVLSELHPACRDAAFQDKFGNFAFAVACQTLSLRNFGFALSPLNSFLILKGIETLHLRMHRHCENALAAAKFLSDHPEVAWVNYAGLPGSQHHQLALNYCPNGAGAVFTFGLKGRHRSIEKFVASVKLLGPSVGVGGARSQVTPLTRNAGGNPPISGCDLPSEHEFSALHLFAGLEDGSDIIADLNQALSS